MRSVETPTVRFELGADGIVRSRPLDTETEPTVEIAERDAAALARLLDGQRRPLVVTLAGVVPADGKVWAALIRSLPKNLTAMAIVSTNPAAMGQFPKAIGALIVPVKVFSNAEDASDWAAQFVESDSI